MHARYTWAERAILASCLAVMLGLPVQETLAVAGAMLAVLLGRT